MTQETTIKNIAGQINDIKIRVIELKNQSAEIPAVENNVNRILASIKMLEINIGDLADII